MLSSDLAKLTSMQVLIKGALSSRAPSGTHSGCSPTSSHGTCSYLCPSSILHCSNSGNHKTTTGAPYIFCLFVCCLFVKFIGSIKALTTALMVFSTAFGTALFGYLIDIGFSIEQIAVVSGTYIFGSIILLYSIKNKLNPHYL